ncbi:MAG: hypothetical protein CVV27_03465 [Candidatus Melainabacteria bacterium HGW-Melainabacteria-1]|nr:MAG: hypothetical protein CVV27_03465 [Candidatus Melainabacteria bacterium HGW-Melainabacteria-1]
MFRRMQLTALAASCLCLQACWVPQVIQGVQPQIFPSTSPSLSPDTAVTLEARIVAMSTRLISIARRTSADIALTADLASHRQALENHLYYNIKAFGANGDFTGWGFADGSYSHYDSQSGARYRLSLLNAQGQTPGFDLLGIGSYGEAPLPAKAFPSDVRSYRLELGQSDTVAGDQLTLSLTGNWPLQVPLRGSFLTTLSGSGSNSGHSAFSKMSLRVDGKSSSDRSLVEGQIGFSAEINGLVYNGFGTLDALGFVGTVDIEQNGTPVARIVRRDKRWDVEINGQVMASGD